MVFGLIIRMSALGQRRTDQLGRGMSASPPIADIEFGAGDVSLVPKAAIGSLAIVCAVCVSHPLPRLIHLRAGRSRVEIHPSFSMRRKIAR